MAATRTPGIRLGPDGRFFIDKRYRGVRIGMRVGAVDLDRSSSKSRASLALRDRYLA